MRIKNHREVSTDDLLTSSSCLPCSAWRTWRPTGRRSCPLEQPDWPETKRQPMGRGFEPSYFFHNNLFYWNCSAIVHSKKKDCWRLNCTTETEKHILLCTLKRKKVFWQILICSYLSVCLRIVWNVRSHEVQLNKWLEMKHQLNF